MTDFLDELERELVAAGRRRSAGARRVTGVPALAPRRWLADLRELASGAMMAASVGVVAVIVALVAASGIHRSPAARRAPATGRPGRAAGGGTGCGSAAAAGQRGWAAVSSAPASGLETLLRVGRRADAGQRRAALRDLDQTASGATSVYVRDIRVLRLARGMRVTLLGARTCPPAVWSGEPRAGSQPSVVAEIRSVDGVATLPLGTVAQIRSGAAFRTRVILLKSPRGPESVAMVPAGVVRIICHGHPGVAGVQRFSVIEHLAVLSGRALGGRCELVRE